MKTLAKLASVFIVGMSAALLQACAMDVGDPASAGDDFAGVQAIQGQVMAADLQRDDVDPEFRTVRHDDDWIDRCERRCRRAYTHCIHHSLHDGRRCWVHYRQCLRRCQHHDHHNHD